jgi:hypothetical protein
VSARVVKVRKPLAEPPYNLDTSDPAIAELVDGLTHYDLANGWTVSVLRVEGGWEAWARRTADLKTRETRRPLFFETEAAAREYRDEIARREGEAA